MLENILTSPYPHRDQSALRANLGLTEAEAGDFTPTGFMLIIERLEAASGEWAKNALSRERRAYQLIHGAVEPYSLAELSRKTAPLAQHLEEFRAAKVFRYAA